MTVDCKKYNVMDGEPQLGKVEECVYTWDREEILDTLIYGFIEGDIYKADDLIWLPDMEDGIKVSEFIEQDDALRIVHEMDTKLVGDDWGSGKDYDLVYKLLDKLLPEKLEFTIETQRYGA